MSAICVVSHDVTFIRNIAEHIIAIDDSGVSRFPGGYDYFLQKQEERGKERERGGIGDGGRGSVRADSAKPAAKGKDARKARAQQREAEKALRKIERQIDQLTEEQAALTEEMMSRRDADFAAINARIAKIQSEIKTLETRWETTAEALS